MTFILGLTTPHLAILAADRRANLPDGGRISFGGGQTITVVGKLTVEGYDKLRLTSDETLVVGAAGSRAMHPYLDRMPSADVETAVERLQAVFFEWSDPKLSLERARMARCMEESFLALTFREEAGGFAYFIGRLLNGVFLAEWGTGGLVHIGSGSTKFEQAVGLEEINRFIGSLTEDTTPSEIRPWFDEAFRRVSIEGGSCGPELSGFFATRADRAFRAW